MVQLQAVYSFYAREKQPGLEAATDNGAVFDLIFLLNIVNLALLKDSQ